MGELTRHRSSHPYRRAAVAVLAAAALALWGAGRALAVTAPAIDPRKDVGAGSCIPCHVEIAAVRTSRLNFDHASHAHLGCAQCHYRMAHEGGNPYSPTMETCLSCHGFRQGPHGQEPSKECETCHPPAFETRPSSHVDDWAGKPHVAPSERDVNACMLCHESPEDCDKCHVAEGVETEKMQPYYIPTGAPRTKSVSPVLLRPYGPTTMGQCIFCHPNLDDRAPGRLIFTHESHLEQNVQCTACHPLYGHGPDRIERPTMASCYRCHGLNHLARGVVATTDCAACHPKEFELLPKDHTAQFIAKSHRTPAERQLAGCLLCHGESSCVTCHYGRKRLPNGRLSKQVIPAEHRKATWQGIHGVQFLRQEGQCAVCHDGPSCGRCHRTVVPHATDWIATHAQRVRVNGAASAGRDCGMCHRDRRECQQCHHGELSRSELIPENCVRCHPEMKTDPPTSIKNKGLAEHAVHFGVEEKKGRPYICHDCHVDFGTTRIGEEEFGVQRSAHDLRLCYGCHGALDYRNRLIAEYSGAELCRRCHADLRI